jgi:hypothetical protein
MAHALHGRGDYLRDLDPLEQAIVELAKMHGFWGLAGLVEPEQALAGTRTMFPYLICSDPGEAVETAILGIKEGGSTGEMRIVEAYRNAPTISVYPHRTHRNVGRSNAVLERKGTLDFVRVFGNALPQDGELIMLTQPRTVLLHPDKEPDWRPA